MVLMHELRHIHRSFSPSLMRTDMAVAGSLGVLGDIICQLVVEQGWFWKHRPPADHHCAEALDVRRTAALGVFGTAYCGAWMHFLLQYYPPMVRAVARQLPHTLPRRMATTGSFPHVFGCAIVDNIHCGLIYTPAFYLTVGPLQGDSYAASAASLRAEWASTYAGCCAFWIPFMCISFTYIPPQRRVQAQNACNLVWTVLVDYIAHRKHHSIDRY